MLCYRCGSHVPDGANKCQVCGQPLAGNSRQSAVRAETGRGPGPLREGQLFADRYLVKNLLKISSIGWLFRARDQDMDADVVLRVVAPNLLQTAEDRATFLAAAKSARRVRHPNIIRIFDSGFEEGVSYYSMPYTQGLSLKKIISLRRENNELFSMTELFGLFAQIASAIDTLGDYGPICSLKPSNIIVLPDLLKIIGIPDYLGLPHLPYVAMQRKQGNLSYMAPSAQKEGQKIDPNADIYSLAVILGEMLTGHRVSENYDAFSLAISAFPQHVRQAFNYIFDANCETFPYICAYDFVTAVFPEEAAREAAETEVSAYDEQTLKTAVTINSPSSVLDEATVQDAAAVMVAVNERTTADIPAQIVAPVESNVTELEIKDDLEIPLTADTTVQDFAAEVPPPVPVPEQVEIPSQVPAEEELVVNAAEMEEEEPPPPPVAPAVVSAQNLINKVSVEESAAVDGDSMPSFGGIPQHLRVEPVTPRDTLIVERPVKPEKGHGGVIAIIVLLLFVLGGGAYWYVNNNGQLPFGTDSSVDKKPVAVKDLAPVKDTKNENRKGPVVAAENEAAVHTEQKNVSRGKNDEKAEPAKRESKSEVRNDLRGSSQAVTKNNEKSESRVVKEESRQVIPAAKEEPVKVAAIKEETQKDPPKSSSETEKAAPQKEVKDEPKAEIKAESKEDAKKTDDTKKSAAKSADTFGAAAAIAAGASQNDEKAGSCPADMIFIPAGNFQMGTASSDSMRDFEDKDLATKYVKGFCIDIYEYPNQAGVKPVQSLSYGQAQKHCQQKGKRLCREEEWEKACKGANNYRFPYGNRYSGTQCNVASGNIVPSGQFVRCKSSYGVFDMAGNLAEWTSSKLEVDLPDRVYKGGGFGSNTIDTRCSARKAGDPNSHEPQMGVRCCKNPL